MCVKRTVNKHMDWKIFQSCAMICCICFSDDFGFIRKLKCQKICATRVHYNWNRPKSNFWKKRRNPENIIYKIVDTRWLIFEYVGHQGPKNRKQFFAPNAFKNRKNCKMTKNDRFLITSECIFHRKSKYLKNPLE